jgi:hypothetical protein
MSSRHHNRHHVILVGRRSMAPTSEAEAAALVAKLRHGLALDGEALRPAEVAHRWVEQWDEEEGEERGAQRLQVDSQTAETG